MPKLILWPYVCLHHSILGMMKYQLTFNIPLFLAKIINLLISKLEKLF